MADTEATVPVVTFKKRGSKANARKRIATPPPRSNSDSDSGFTSGEDENGRQIKRRRRDVGVTATSTNKNTPRAQDDSTQTSSLPLTIASNADNATKTSNWYDEEENKSNVKRNLATSTPQNDANSSDRTYKGVANYQSFVKKDAEKSNKFVGPQKTSSNVRTITVTDFAPDVCKDYKQTGFCGFGDSCKFLHAREAYAQGWELDREWEISTKGKKLTGRTVATADRNAKTNEGEVDDDALLEKIPFACIICKEGYKNPIVTKCGHYFCEACALKRYRKDPSCAACGAGTGGVFNVAKKLNALLDRKRERQKLKREKAIENGEDPPSEEEG